jgi:hypothetical protein
MYHLISTSDNYLTAAITPAVLLFTTSVLSKNRPNPHVVLTSKEFLASPPSINPEPIHGTDISMKPLGAVIVLIIINCCVVASFLSFLFLQAKGREIRMNTALHDCLDSII